MHCIHLNLTKLQKKNNFHVHTTIKIPLLGIALVRSYSMRLEDGLWRHPEEMNIFWMLSILSSNCLSSHFLERQHSSHNFPPTCTVASTQSQNHSSTSRLDPLSILRALDLCLLLWQPMTRSIVDFFPNFSRTSTLLLSTSYPSICAS